MRGIERNLRRRNASTGQSTGDDRTRMAIRKLDADYSAYEPCHRSRSRQRTIAS